MKMFDVSFLITFPANFTGLSAAEERRRKKKSRWGGSDNEKTFIPGMPTVLPSTMSADQQEAYLGKYYICFLTTIEHLHATINSIGVLKWYIG